MIEHILYQQPLVTQTMRQAMLHQFPHLFWFTGLSGAGKSTIAHAMEEKIFAQGRLTYIFDGDNVRHGLCRDLSFSASDRSENIRRIGEMAKLFMDAGIICLAAFISPMRVDREEVRAIVGEENFSEIYIRCSLQVCEARDVKGNYKKARAGLISNYTGVSSPYEEPKDPALIVDTDKNSIEDCVNSILEYALPKIRYSAPPTNDHP